MEEEAGGQIGVGNAGAWHSAAQVEDEKDLGASKCDWGYTVGVVREAGDGQIHVRQRDFDSPSEEKGFKGRGYWLCKGFRCGSEGEAEKETITGRAIPLWNSNPDVSLKLTWVGF